MKITLMMKTKPMMQQKITGESITESDLKSVRKMNNINLYDGWLRFVTTHLDFKKSVNIIKMIRVHDREGDNEKI